MAIDLRLGDIVRLKKAHPCSGFEWEITRVGADFGIKCIVCCRHVLMSRSSLEKRIKNVVT